MPSDGAIRLSDVTRRLSGDGSHDAGGISGPGWPCLSSLRATWLYHLARTTSDADGTLEGPGTPCSSGARYPDSSITDGVGFCRGIVTTGKKNPPSPGTTLKVLI
jgi:hypothetical protein